jgi:DNA polymerase-3 subunit alpha
VKTKLRALKSSEEFDKIKELIGIAKEDDLAGEIQQAKILEGSMRNTGIHACGVIITPSDITNSRQSDLYGPV